MARLLTVLVAVLVLAAPAFADDGDEVRARGTCSGPGRAELRLRADDGRIRVEFRVERAGRGTWNMVLLHERRLVARAKLRSTGRLDYRRSVADWFGSDAVAVRATSARGETCRASATLE